MQLSFEKGTIVDSTIVSVGYKAEQLGNIVKKRGIPILVRKKEGHHMAQVL